MVEKVITEANANEEIGSVIGQPVRLTPGLTLISQQIQQGAAKLVSQVASLEAAGHELSQIRATLLVNFGPTRHNRYGFTVLDSPGESTHSLLFGILQQLTQTRGQGNEPAA